MKYLYKRAAICDFERIFILILIINIHFVFAQSTPSLKLIEPSGGEKWIANTTQIIKWKSSGISKVRIEYSLSNGLDWIVVNNSVDASLGEYSWYVPNVQRSEVLIRISNLSDLSMFVMNTEKFGIYIHSKANKAQKFNKVETLTISDSIKIMPLGNSITWGTNPNDANSPGYRRLLYNQLKTNGYKINFVGSQNGGLPNDFDRDNEGHPGWSAGAPIFNPDLNMTTHLSGFLSSNPPDIVLLHIGTNDITETGNSWEKTASQLAHVVKGLLDIIYNFNPNITTFVAKIIDRNDTVKTGGFSADYRHIKTMNFNGNLADTINNLPKPKREKVVLVDMYSALGIYWGTPTNPNFTNGADNLYWLHPNTTGYGVMANTWLPFLENYLPVLRLRVFLQGPYDNSSHRMTTSLSRTDLINSPYSEAPKTVAYTVPDSITDWVLLQFRETSIGTNIASKSCFLSKNGYVIDPDGLSKNISLGTLVDPTKTYYIVVKHRNHLAVMSADAVELKGITAYDFTTGSNKYYGTVNGAKQLETNVWGMIAGNSNGNNSISVNDYNAVANNLFHTGYEAGDHNLNGSVSVTDYNFVANNLFRTSQVP